MEREHAIDAASLSHNGSVASAADSLATEPGPAELSPTISPKTSALEQLSDELLLEQTRLLVGHSNRVLAALLAHLAEVDARGVHRVRACSSLYTYCIYELRFSEDEAARRVTAARLVKRFPAILSAVERGELHLTGLLLLGPHLTAENHHGVLIRAKHRTKKEIQRLVRELSPLLDVPACIEPLAPVASGALEGSPTWAAGLQSLCSVRELRSGDRPADWLGEPMIDAGAGGDGEDASAIDVTAPARVELCSAEVAGLSLAPVTTPQRYRVQFSAGEEYVALVERARALLSHALPNADLEDLHARAMRALVVELEKRRYAVNERQRRAIPDSARSTLEPAAPAASAQRGSHRRVTDTAERGDARGAEHGAERDADFARDRVPAPMREKSRAVPARVRRAVFDRDAGLCTYVDGRGRRCCETHRLEFHHVEPFANGGAHHAANLCLRCTAHNALAAEQDFGRRFMQQHRDASRHESARSQARRSQ